MAAFFLHVIARAPDAAQRSCGALQSRGRNERRLVRSRLCGAA
jgi:hypothetical protein